MRMDEWTKEGRKKRMLAGEYADEYAGIPMIVISAKRRYGDRWTENG